MKTQVITIEKKRYRLVPEEEYRQLQADIEDIKKVFSRRNEKGEEINAFFSRLEKGKK